MLARRSLMRLPNTAIIGRIGTVLFLQIRAHWHTTSVSGFFTRPFICMG